MPDSDAPNPADERRDAEASIRELTRLAVDAPAEWAARAATLPLRRQAEVALRLPPRERFELLLHAPQPMRLVRMLPDADVYLTIREVGPADALPLLALASAEQLVHLLDLESWRGDRFDADRAGAWLALLVEAGEPAVLRFVRAADDEVMALLFARWARIHPIEIEDTPSIGGHGETEAGTEEGFLSPDGYHRFSPTIVAHAPAVRRVAEAFRRQDERRYGEIAWAALWELPSELEEGAFRWRQSRLEEHGFPDPDSAREVYAPPAGAAAKPGIPAPSREDALPAPRAPLRAAPGDSLLARAVEAADAADAERILFEWTAVANRILVADAADAGDPAAHRAALARAAAYVGIALRLRGASDGQTAGRLLATIPLLELFREGFARVLDLHHRARRFVREGWPSRHPRAMETLDAPLRPMVAALLERPPRFHDPAAGATAETLRDFRSIEEVEEARIALHLSEVLGRTLDRVLGWNLPELLGDPLRSGAPPRLGRLFLTSLAWHEERSMLRAGPLPRDVAERFLARAGAPGEGGAMLERFLQALGGSGGLTDRDVASLRPFGRAALADLAPGAKNVLLVTDRG